VERCLASSVAKAMADRCEADSVETPEGSRFYPNSVCSQVLDTPALIGWACPSRRLPRTSPDAPITHGDSLRSVSTQRVENQTASWDVSGSRLLDNFSEMRRLFARMAQVTENG